jgi:hypothetical protein
MKPDPVTVGRSRRTGETFCQEEMPETQRCSAIAMRRRPVCKALPMWDDGDANQIDRCSMRLNRSISRF